MSRSRIELRATARALAASVLLLSGCHGHQRLHLSATARAASRLRHATRATAKRAVVLGRSAQGRPVRAFELGNSDAKRVALVVGCIHGDETAGISVARRLERGAPVAGVELWI